MNARPSPRVMPPPPPPPAPEPPGPERLRNSIIAMVIIFSLTLVQSVLQKEPTSRWFEGVPSSLMVVPPGEDPAQPIIIALHDKGETMDVAAEHWKPRCVEQGCALVVIQGPRAHEQGYAWNEGQDEVAAAWTQIDRIFEDRSRSGIPALGDRPLVLAGLGQGADMAWAMSLRQPERVRGLVLVNHSQGEASKLGLWKARDQVRVALLSGEREGTILEKARRARDTLAGESVPVALYVHPEGRRMPATPQGHDALTAALRFALSREAAPASPLPQAPSPARAEAPTDPRESTPSETDR